MISLNDDDEKKILIRRRRERRRGNDARGRFSPTIFSLPHSPLHSHSLVISFDDDEIFVDESIFLPLS